MSKVKLIAIGLVFIIIFSAFTGCALFQNSLPEQMPKDFRFSITWNTDGISSYDSKTGILVKDKYSSKPEEYTTTYFLSDDELKEVYALIYELNIDSYPDEIPYGTFAAADPSSKLILSVSTGDYSKTVIANSVGAYEAYTIKGEKYLNVIRSIREILTNTEEWKALPDYEFYRN